jgi:glycerol kinase
VAQHILAIDQGTTSTRAIVFDRRLKPIATAQRELRQFYPKPGWVEHDPEEIDRHHQSARDHDRLEPQDREGDPPRHRLAGPADRIDVRRAERGWP